MTGPGNCWQWIYWDRMCCICYDPPALTIKSLCNGLAHIATRWLLQQAYDFSEYVSLKLRAVLIVLPNTVVIQWFQIALLWPRLFRLSNVMLWLVSTPVAVNCVPYIAISRKLTLYICYGDASCWIVAVAWAAHCCWGLVVGCTAMSGAVVLNYGVHPKIMLSCRLHLLYFAYEPLHL